MFKTICKRTLKRVHIPVVDVSSFRDLYLNGNVESAINSNHNGIKNVIQTVHESFRDFSGVIVTGHGIDPLLFKECMENNYQFQQSYDKLRSSDQQKIRLNQGYRGFLDYFETVTPETQLLEPSQGLSYYAEINISENNGDILNLDLKYRNLATMNNPLPDNVINSELLSNSLNKYVFEMSFLGECILSMLGIGLNLPFNYFSDIGNLIGNTNRNNTFYMLKVLKYLSKNETMQKAKEYKLNNNEFSTIYGTGPHTDEGGLSFISCNTISDEIFQFHCHDYIGYIDPVPNAYFIFLGDFIEFWTNGFYKALIHQTLLSDKPRYSIPFFYDPSFFANNKPIPMKLNDFKDEMRMKKIFKSAKNEYKYGEYLWYALQKTRRCRH